MNNEQTTPARDFQTCDGCKNDLVCHDQGECFNLITDYGEPWDNELRDFEIYPRTGGEAIAYAEGSTTRDRIIACINACAGRADPAAEIASMREAIREARKVLLANEFNSGINGTLCQVCFSHFSKGHKGNCAFAAAIAKLQPFIK